MVKGQKNYLQIRKHFLEVCSKWIAQENRPILILTNFFKKNLSTANASLLEKTNEGQLNREQQKQKQTIKKKHLQEMTVEELNSWNSTNRWLSGNILTAHKYLQGARRGRREILWYKGSSNTARVSREFTLCKPPNSSHIPDTMMIHSSHTDATYPAMPCSGWSHQLALGTPILFHLGGASSQHPGRALQIILQRAVVETARRICAEEPFGFLLPFSVQALNLAAA